MKKISVKRFKPRPEYFAEILANIKERSRESELAERSTVGVDWLDTHRPLSVEYSDQDLHAKPLTGKMVTY